MPRAYEVRSLKFEAALHFVPCVSAADRSEEHTSELQSQSNLVCRLLLEKKKHVIVDLVVNHTSDQHPCFKTALQDPDSHYRDCYVLSKFRPKNWTKRMVFTVLHRATCTP